MSRTHRPNDDRTIVRAKTEFPRISDLVISFHMTMDAFLEGTPRVARSRLPRDEGVESEEVKTYWKRVVLA